jgi:branched-chain amino acid transport system permease protein
MTERKITVDGKQIHIRESEGTDASFPVLLCIHGNLGSGRWFEPLMAAYPGRCIAPDMPNFGQSDHLNEWTIAAYASWIAKICDAIGVTDLAVLGHSLGGAVAMELLAAYPVLVRRLILVDSSPIDGLITPKEYYPAIEAYKSDKNILGQALKAVVPMIQDEEFFQKLLDDAWKMNRDCFIGHAEELAGADYRERLRGVEVAVSVFRGAHDALITAEHADHLAAFFGGAVHTFVASGHSPMVEIPLEFTEKLVEILREEA